jgi:hypothetical protein
MIDIDTFLTTLYVMVDDYFKEQIPTNIVPGRPSALTTSEVVTLAMFSQWYIFRSERDFYCWAQRHLRSAFPTLPDRSQYNRLVRNHQSDLVAIFSYFVSQLQADHSLFEVLDTTGVPVRNVKRRGGLVRRIC